MPITNTKTHSLAARLASGTAALAAMSAALLLLAPGAQAKTTKHHAKKHGHAAHISRARTWRPITVGFSGGADQLLGPSFNASANYSNSQYAAWARRAKSVGTQMVRIDVFWAGLEPNQPATAADATDPTSSAYDQAQWSNLDQLVQNVTNSGFKILMMVNDAPAWAEGSDIPSDATAGSWKPNATALGQFATALATRYSGSFTPSGATSTLPRITDWQAWNEPNLSISLAPQWVRSGKHWRPVSPSLYRSMQNAFYTAVKSVSSKNYVIEAGLAPYGDPAGGTRMHPVSFEQWLLCLNNKLKRTGHCGATHFDAFDSHPYSNFRPTRHAYNRLDTATPDVTRLTRVVQAGERARTVAPRGRKGIWSTEIGWTTNPPARSGVGVQKEARWVEQATYLLWKQGVSTVLWWELGDTPPYVGQQYVLDKGIYYQNGRAKPSARATKFPFVAVKSRRISHNRNRVTTWGRSPARGTLVIQAHERRRWRTLKRLRVTNNQVFQTPITLPRQRINIRARVGRTTSLTWSVPR